jgi:hypothetical protein
MASNLRLEACIWFIMFGGMAALFRRVWVFFGGCALALFIAAFEIPRKTSFILWVLAGACLLIGICFFRRDWRLTKEEETEREQDKPTPYVHQKPEEREIGSVNQDRTEPRRGQR